MAELKKQKPISESYWSLRERIYPNLRFPIADPKVEVFFYAPIYGYIEKYDSELMLFRHKEEPYYSFFNGDNLKVDKELLVVGQEVQPGTILGSVRNELYWRIGEVGNVKDWFQPEQWLNNKYEVWQKAVGPKAKGKTDWGTIALVVGLGYTLLKGK